MNLLDGSVASVEPEVSGGLRLRLTDGAAYENVCCAPLFPFSNPDHFVSLVQFSGDERREIGVICDPGRIAAAQQDLIRKDIRFRYFIPEITDIKSLTGKRGIDTWVVDTDRGEKTFRVQDRKENVIVTDNGTLFVTDINTCRYKITRSSSLSIKAKALLEKVLY
jgi:hypothetical protein